ncbi:phage tail protein, partial [Yersinia enterocolitica]
DLARRTAVQLALYQKLLEDWQDITTGTGDVTIIAPDGSTVVIPSLSDLTAWVNDSKTWFDDNRELIENAGEAVAGAETARDEAVAAKTAAQSAEAAAEGSATSASGSATTASDAAAAATDSASIASEAATIATQSKDGAVTARDEAEQFAESVNPDLLMHTTGGTFTGPVILAGDATDLKGAVTKQQLDAKPAGGLPLLHSYQTDTRDHIEAGEAPQDGQLLSRALFPDAWAAIQAKRTVITDAAWLGDPLKRGQFSSGDGSTTFRVPDKNGKYSGSLGATVGRGDGVKSAGTVGLLQMDAARNITGSFEFSPSTGLVLDISTLGGAFVKGTTNKAAGTNAQTIGAKDLLFDASKSPGFLVADENRVLSVTTCWVIKLAGAAFNEGQINALELATQITLLATRVTTLETHQKIAVLYPGGTAAVPGTIAANQVISVTNPFPGRLVAVRAEVYYNAWGEAGWDGNTGSGSPVTYGVKAVSKNADIAVVSGTAAPMGQSNLLGNALGLAANTINPIAYRVIIWTID